MALKIFTVLALCLATTAPGRAATVVDMQLIRAAFFSDACRQEAEALGIARTSDANALLAAFAGLHRRPASLPAANGRNDCGLPAVAVINLLRLNGIDAELVSATMAKEAAPADQVERVLVYVPTLARYFDPALPLEEQRAPACMCTRRQATQRRPSASKPRRSAAAERRPFRRRTPHAEEPRVVRGPP